MGTHVPGQCPTSAVSRLYPRQENEAPPMFNRALRALCAALFLVVSTSPAFGQVWINEIHYDDSTGTGDTGEMVEVAGAAGTDLTGWSIVLYNGGNGASYDTDALS